MLVGRRARRPRGPGRPTADAELVGTGQLSRGTCAADALLQNASVARLDRRQTQRPAQGVLARGWAPLLDALAEF